MARRFGITAPLPDTPSLPIGADEVTVLEHAVAYATFPNKGKSVTPHAVLEVRTGAGDLVWRFDRDGKKPLQAIPASVASDMVGMMSHVVSEGTARRAALDGIPTAGKTGTTNAYRDAWFVGYTGNFTCAVWYGNDDYSPTNRMTGGSLPAQTWHDIMTAAHQGVEIKDIAGYPGEPETGCPGGHDGRGQRRGEAAGDQAGTAAGPDQTRRGYSGPGGKNARRCRQDRGKRRVRTIRLHPASRYRRARSPSRIALRRRRQAARLRLRRARTDPVRLIFITLLALILATVVGLGATWMTATRGTDLGTLTIGAWTARPKTGTADVDPYSARLDRPQRRIAGRHRRRRGVLGDDGRPQAAARWTLRRGRQRRHARRPVLDADAVRSKGHLVANSLQRYGFTSQEIIRGADGAFEVRVASRSRAGNWLPTGGIERYALMLRLYDTPVGVATRTQRDAPMPSIATVGCP